MIRLTLTVGQDDLAAHAGAVLCRDLAVQTPRGHATIRRGTVLDPALEARLRAEAGLRLSIVMPEPGEIAQGEASRQIAQAIIGDGVEAEEPHQGQVVIRAATDGLLRVNRAGVESVNQRGTVLLVTSIDGRLINAKDVVAVVKPATLWIPSAEVNQAIQAAGDAALLRVARFTARRAAFLAGERIRPANFDLAAPNLTRIVERFGASLTHAEQLTDDIDTIAAAYRAQVRAGVEVVLVAGSILLDPQDPYLVALQEVGGHLIIRGAPIDPGTMFWVGQIGPTVFLGLASCELYGRLSILDLILPFVIADEPITQGLFAALGYGGLIEQTQAARRLIRGEG